MLDSLGTLLALHAARAEAKARHGETLGGKGFHEISPNEKANDPDGPWRTAPGLLSDQIKAHRSTDSRTGKQWKT
ncbi:hypothetical protein [Breoghania sp.]|uniref:hypothetical protein n=1 Tax=Breoghania sp. TaxID=2065378 RepID=UPI0026317AB0|nr:hypothetical protein [Breoghania sp.]MDJ0932617.1 hypothetical protein [Breoghania sp.]